MSRIYRRLVILASLVTVLSSAGLANASHYRSAVERRQHPGRGFVKDTGHHVQEVRLLRR
ncbi:hypothetical protein [Stieleria mannarensis]|uniref:hypothetical protein n=1 Tax=Stieleria mannarensis TaxID=2755585 RepID=UPI0016016C6F|nr:hypothetical protein [Rhodopirellula sp. JC639]